jgi:hypothetical protein
LANAPVQFGAPINPNARLAAVRSWFRRTHPIHSSGGTIPIFNPKERANGGANTGETPVDLSDGEFLIHPADVDRFGNGDRSRGHAFFDKWVVRKRKEHISKLKSLPGPVKPRAA